LDLVVIVAVVNYLALVVEAQHRHSREREFPALLGPAAPPFDRGPVTRDDRLAEPALDILLGRKVLTEIPADASQAQVRLAERGRAVYRGLGVQRGDGLGIAPRPGPRPGICPATCGGLSIHASDSTRMLTASRFDLQ